MTEELVSDLFFFSDSHRWKKVFQFCSILFNILKKNATNNGSGAGFE